MFRPPFSPHVVISRDELIFLPFLLGTKGVVSSLTVCVHCTFYVYNIISSIHIGGQKLRVLELRYNLGCPFFQKSRSPLYIAILMVLIYWLMKIDPSHLICTSDVVYTVRRPRFLYQIYQ